MAREVSVKRHLIITAAVAIAVTAVAAWAHWPEEPLPDSARADKVVVRKSARILELYSGERLLRTYPVALGREPTGHKEREGDGRTPEGTYLLDYRKRDSAFHRALHVSYPSALDRARAQAAGVSPGGFIMVHGLRNGFGWIGRLHLATDWTDGCVAVTDRQIREIWRVVPDGTPIVILP